MINMVSGRAVVTKKSYFRFENNTRKANLEAKNYKAFVNLEKVSDSVHHWSSLFKILEETGTDFRDKRILCEISQEQKAT